MYADITFSPSAFKHGATEADIRSAFSTCMFDGAGDYDASKYLVIGFDSSQNLIEVMYNITDEGNIHVFHAMKCRKEYTKYIEG